MEFCPRNSKDPTFNLLNNHLVEKIIDVIKKEANSFDFYKMKNTFAGIEKVFPSNGRRTGENNEFDYPGIGG